MTLLRCRFRTAPEAPFGRKLSLEGRGHVLVLSQGVWVSGAVCVAGAPRRRGAGGDDAAEGRAGAGKHLQPGGRPVKTRGMEMNSGMMCLGPVSLQGP